MAAPSGNAEAIKSTRLKAGYRSVKSGKAGPLHAKPKPIKSPNPTDIVRLAANPE